MKDYSEKADSNLVGKLGFRQEETLPFSNLDDRFCTCGDRRAAGAIKQLREQGTDIHAFALCLSLILLTVRHSLIRGSSAETWCFPPRR